jgi:hypothetical protein
MPLILTQFLVLVEMWAILLKTKCEGGKKHPTPNEKQECQLDWSHIEHELSSNTSY